LLAWAIRNTSSFFFTASPVPSQASMISLASLLEKFEPFFDFAAFIIHLNASACCLFGGTSMGIWYTDPPTLFAFTSRIGATFLTALSKASAVFLYPLFFIISMASLKMVLATVFFPSSMM